MSDTVGRGSARGARARQQDGADAQGLGLLLGHVTEVRATRLAVELDDAALASLVTVLDLVTIAAGASELVIGLVEAVRRRSPSAAEAAAGAGPAGAEPAGSGPAGAGTAGAGPAGAGTAGAVELELLPIGVLRGSPAGGVSSFARAAGSFPCVGAQCRRIDGERLRGVMEQLAGVVERGQRLALGRHTGAEEVAAIADGDRLLARHVAVVGSSGTGKSWLVALLAERAAALGHANMVILDLHGEYGPLSEAGSGRAPIARSLRVAGAADAGAGDQDAVLALPYWMLHRDELMSLLLDQEDPYASDHAFRFAEHVRSLKRIALADSGAEQALDSFTVDSPIPYRIEHLIAMLRDEDSERIARHPGNHLDPGPYHGRLRGFIARLEARVADPRYAFIFNPPEETLDFAWLGDVARRLLGAGAGPAGIKIIDLSEVPAVVMPMVAGIIARFLYELQFWMAPQLRTPLCLVCDEAHLYIPPVERSGPGHAVALRAFEAIAKEGRKYGVGLVVVSQRPSDVSPTILSQCNNFVVLRLTNDRDRATVERLLSETLIGVTGVLPALDVGEAIVIGDAMLLPTRVRLDAPRVAPASATQPHWTLWSRRASSDEAIAAGAESLRRQVRVPPAALPAGR